MKILHVADIHLNHAWCDWITSCVSGYDLLVIAGDAQNAFSATGTHDQARALSKWLVKLPCDAVALCSGNHDYWPRDRRFHDVYAEAGWIRLLRGKSPIIAVDGDTVEYGGLTIHVNGWRQIPPLNSPRADIMITHAPPAGCPCAFGDEGRDVGDDLLWKALPFPPRLLLCGHVHAPSERACQWPPDSRLTTVLVPGFDDHATFPSHWVIDTTAMTAVHSCGDRIIFGP